MTRELPSSSSRSRDAVVRATVIIVAVSWLIILGGPLEAQSFLVSPIMSSASSHVSKRLEQTGLPASFTTFSSSGVSVAATFQTLGRQVANDIGECSGEQGSWRLGAIGVLFYAIGEGMTESDSGIEHALAGLNIQLPFVSSIIASQVRATSTSSEKDVEESGEGSIEPTVTATLALIGNPHLEVYPYVVNPQSNLAGEAARLREDAIGVHVGEALERNACRESIAGQYSTICMVFGGGRRAEKEGGKYLHKDGSTSSIELVNRLNSIVRRARCENESRNRLGKSCPLVTSFTDTGAATFLSVRQNTNGEIVTLAADAVGAVLSCRAGSKSFFQLVHAGRHIPLGGSQFRIKRMQGDDIVEVMPVQWPVPTGPPVSVDGSSWPRPRCGEGAVTAAEWCRQVVTSSTCFEKMAIQSALGVGVLVRMSGSSDCGGCEATRESSGLIRCFPAEACFEVAEVSEDGLLRVAGRSTGQLRAGDLCDFRAVGELAAIQAESDAYTWFRLARLAASIRQVGCDHTEKGGELPPASFPEIHGCLVAGAGPRFIPRSEGDGCLEIVRKAAGHGACATIGLFCDVHHVSVDNEVMTCPDSIGSTNVYICNEA